MTKEEIQQLTGANTIGTPQKQYKVIRFNGKKGHFTIVHLDEPKIEVEGHGAVERRYRSEDVTSPLSVVFLRVGRRALMQGSRDEGILKYTNEHTSPNDVVTLTIRDGMKKVQGIARELREQYPELKTTEFVFVRYKGAICKLSVKGLSLYKKDDDTSGRTNYYEYRTANPEFWTHLTTLSSVAVGDYYGIDFTRGADITPEQQEEVFKNIKEVAADLDKAPATPTAPETTIEMPDYPEEEINPEDIPF